MILVGRAQNIDKPGTYVSAAPFVSFEQVADNITIKNITGLTANTSYTLRLVAFV
jgi:hypothetical protein